MTAIGKATKARDACEIGRLMLEKHGDLLAKLARPINPCESGNASPGPAAGLTGQPQSFDPDPPSDAEIREAARFKYGF